MTQSILKSLLRRGFIAIFPLAGALAASQVARADAGAEFNEVQGPAGITTSVQRVYAVTRGDMDYMGVSKLEFYEIEDARSGLDIVRGLIAKMSPAGEISLDSWCKEQPAPASAGPNACARHQRRVRLEGDSLWIAGMQPGQGDPRVQQPGHPSMQHERHRRIDPFHRRTRASGSVSCPVREALTDWPGCTKRAK